LQSQWNFASGSLIYKTSGPQFTTVALKKTLTLRDHEGHLANLEREQRIRVNYGSIPEIWRRSIYADGNMDNFNVDGKPVAASDQVLSSGKVVEIRKRFPEAIFSGHDKTVKWSYDLHDSFPENHEALDHVVIPGTQTLELIVVLPPDRRCIQAALHVLAGGEPIDQLEGPEISADRTTLRALRRSPKSGHTLRLSWDW
jgi:hypothetical protein